MRISVSALLKAGALALAALPSLASAAWVHFDPADTSKVPKKFSQTNFYTNITAKVKTVTAEAAKFDVNSPLWSDNAAKQRWIILKSTTEKVVFNPADDYWAYPEGTVMVKLFQHDTLAGDTTSRIYWETRLLVKKKRPDTVNTEPLEVILRDHWYPFTYKWNAAGTDADLVSLKKGLDTTLMVTVKGVKTFRKWRFPSEANCNECHRQFANGTQGRAVLGFFTAQLNRPTAPNSGLNQIRDLFNRNILAWSKPAAPTEAELDTMPRWARLTDNVATLDKRARSYIAANCSGCHGTRGMATHAIGESSINYDFFNTIPAMELRHYGTSFWDLEPLVTAKGDTLLPKLIVPGYPEISVLLHRMKVRNRANPLSANQDEKDTAFFRTAAQMPPVGVFEEDTLATKLVKDWILAMPDNVSIRKGLAGHAALLPRIKGDVLTLPQGLQGKVALTGLDGRAHALVRLSEISFRIPQGITAGVYLLRVGSRTFKLVR